MGSALLSYLAGRLWGRPLLERLVPEARIVLLDAWLARESAFPLLALRLVPLVPFNAVGLAAGAAAVPLWPYTWTTGLGILPLGVSITYLGSQLGERRPHLGAAFWGIIAVLVVAVLVAWSLRHRLSRPPRPGDRSEPPVR